MADFLFGSPFRRLFHARPFPAFEWSSGGAVAAMDWVETPASHVLRVNVPGLGKDDVKVQVEDLPNALTIRGAPPAPKDKGKGKHEEDDEEGTVWHVAERGKPEFARAVALPENVRVDGIRAAVENGVLTVVVPKEAAPARTKPRPVAVSSKL